MVGDKPISRTIQRIVNNSILNNRMNRNNNDLLRCYMTEKKLSPLVDDEDMLKKINKNKMKLRFEQELKELYEKPFELKQIEQEEDSSYMGYIFRKWYYEIINEFSRHS